MANSIDNKVVEMKFDNKQFEQAISQTIASLEKLTKSLQLNGAVDGLAGVTAAANSVDLSGVEKGAGKVDLAMLALGTVAFQVFSRITNAAIDTGMKVAKALTVDGMSAGFKEYELKMGAIQTMMASTGESLSTVNKYLQELNEYSDQTIYSFADMTQNIGKFTNAGVKLPVAVSAIKGIANVAALSGANAEEASRAMYNFSQALSKGSVALIDWKSIELANMGTVEFKQQLLDAGVAAGTLKKSANGMYQVLSKNGQGSTMDQTISATKNFNDSLSFQWMTTEVLTGTLGDYADATTDIGKRATLAATEVKTFSQMMDTIRESIGSGWSATMENIFGDKEESTKMWTDIANAIGSIITPMADARNELLGFWNENGGRAAIIEGLANVFKTLKAVIMPVVKAFQQLFPAMTGQELVQLSWRFRDFTQTLMPSKKALENIGKIAKGIFSVFSLLGKAVKFVAQVFGTVFGVIFGQADKLSGIGSSIMDGVAGIFEFFTQLNNAAAQGKIFEKMLLAIKGAITSVVTKFKELVAAVMETEIFRVTLGPMTKTLQELGKIISGVFGTASDASDKARGKVASFGEQFTGVIDKIKPVLSSFGEWISKIFNGIDFGNIIETFNMAFAALGFLEFRKMVSGVLDATNAVSGTVAQYAGFLQRFGDSAMQIFDGLTGALKGMQNNLNAKALKEIAIAVGILALSMLVLSTIDPEKLQDSFMAMTAMLLELMVVMKAFSDGSLSGGTGMFKSAAALTLLGVGLFAMALAVKVLSTVDPDALTAGVLAFGAVLAELGLFSKLVSTDANLMSAGAGMILMGVAMLIFAGALKIIGTMDPAQLTTALGAIAALFAFVILQNKLVKSSEISSVATNMIVLSSALVVMGIAMRVIGSLPLETIGKGLLGMAVGLGIMVTAMRFIPTDAAAKSAGLLIMAGAVYILGLALQQIGGMGIDSLIQSLVGLGVALGIIAIFLNVVSSPTVLIGAAALLIVSGALLVLAAAMKVLGSMSPEQLITALIAMAAGFAIIAAAGYLLTGALPGLLGLGLALLMIGAGIFLAATGVALFAAGIALLGTALAAGGAIMVTFLLALANILPLLALKLAEALGAFALGLVSQQEKITAAILSLFTAVLNALTEMVPKILEFISMVLTGVLNLLVEKIPEIVNAVLLILIGIMEAIQTNLPRIIELAGQIAVSFIDGMSAYYDKIIAAGTNFIINLIRGIGKNMLKVANAAMDTVIKFIEGLATAIRTNGARFDRAANDLISAVFERIESLIGTTFNFATLGGNVVTGLVKGITDFAWKAADAVRTLVSDAFSAGQSESDSHSPSRLFMKLGFWWVDGLVAALKSTGGKVADSARTVVSGAYSAMTAAAEAATDVFSGIEDPVISPVVDLSKVHAGAKAVAAAMNGAVGVTGDIGRGMSKSSAGLAAAASTDASGGNTQFIQNIYSPKAVSRLEIYRQTHNLVNVRGLTNS